MVTTDRLASPYPDQLGLYSGMVIGESPGRDALSEKFRQIGGIALGFALGEEDHEAYDRVMNSVAEVEGVRVIEPGNVIEHANYHCVHFAFGVVNGEEWAQPSIPISEADDPTDDTATGHPLATEPIDFLRNQGYERVRVPAPGDIVAYSYQPWDTLQPYGNFRHFGVLRHNGLVLSKFNSGPIVEHYLDLVPYTYGSYIHFLRKEPRGRAD